MRTKIILGIVAVLIALAVILIAVGQGEPEVSVETEKAWPAHAVIGKSVLGRNIEAYIFRSSNSSASALQEASANDEGKHLLFVGGIHGGYEWNSVLLAYQFIDYLEDNPGLVPDNITVSVIPSANPDGVFEVIGKEGRFALSDVPEEANTLGAGRFNANDVDLNRNFDCKWQSESSWRGNTVSAGTHAFSEPEAEALRDFIMKNNPDVVVFWHSQASAVYASECEDGILPETLDVMNVYSEASGYRAVDSFDAYPITGDAEGWLASLGIPAVTVELTTHETIEWEENLAGVKALFEYYKN